MSFLSTIPCFAWTTRFGIAFLSIGATLGHLNSPHVYLEESIGPYPAIVIVHMPPAVPGEAEVQVRLQGLASEKEARVQVREIPPQGPDTAPGWVEALRSQVDPHFFTAPVPLMVYGDWRIEVRVQGERGSGLLDLPVRAGVAPPETMGAEMTFLLGGLILLFFASMWQILSALGRDAHRAEDQEITSRDLRRGRLFALLGTLFFLVIFGFVGFQWYRTNQTYANLGQPPLVSQLDFGEARAVAGRRLPMRLIIREREGAPLWDVKPDHGKMMHLLIVKLPGYSYLLHVHPRMIGPGAFEFEFTPPSPGKYKLFGDILRASGVGETVTNVLEIEDGEPPTAFEFADIDDSHSFQAPLDVTQTANTSYAVEDGLTMHWRRGSGAIIAGEFAKLEFQMTNADGELASGLEPYMGMSGHMLVIRQDAEVFAHVHPMGTLGGRMSVPDPDRSSPGGSPMQHSGMQHSMTPPTGGMGSEAVATFPFAFPEAGIYRLWVQMKLQENVYTGVFDVTVEE